MTRRWDIGLGASFVAVLAAAATLSVSDGHVVLPGGATVGVACPWQLFGHACPFCGLTRSIIATAHGDLGAALAFHVGGPLLVAVLAGSVVAMLVAAARRARPLFASPAYARVLETTALVCLVAGAARWLW